FGANALSALRAADGPLAGSDIRLVHTRYSWDDTQPLAALLDKLRGEQAVIAASSEGALFEYGDDDAIVANLRILCMHGVEPVVGSVTRADDLARATLADSQFKLIPRGIDKFAALADRAGLAIAHVEEALMSDQVLLRAQRTSPQDLAPR